MLHHKLGCSVYILTISWVSITIPLSLKSRIPPYTIHPALLPYSLCKFSFANSARKNCALCNFYGQSIMQLGECPVEGKNQRRSILCRHLKTTCIYCRFECGAYARRPPEATRAKIHWSVRLQGEANKNLWHRTRFILRWKPWGLFLNTWHRTHANIRRCSWVNLHTSMYMMNPKTNTKKQPEWTLDIFTRISRTTYLS